MSAQTSSKNLTVTLFSQYLAWLKEFENVGRLEDLERMIGQLRDELVPDAAIGLKLLRIATAYEEKYRRTEDLEDLQAQTILLHESSNAMPVNHPDKSQLLHWVTTAYFELYARTKSAEDFSTLTELLELMLQLNAGDNSHRARVHQQFATAHQTEHEVTGTPESLDEKIRHIELALTLMPQSSPDRLHWSKVLASAMDSRCHRTGDEQHLRSFIRHAEATMELMPEDDELMTDYLATIGAKLFLLYLKVKERDVPQRSVDMSERALLRLPETHEKRTLVLLEQAKAYMTLSEISGDIAYLEVSAREARDSLSRMPTEHPIRPSLLLMTANMWGKLCQTTQREDYVETAIVLFEELYENPPKDSPTREEILRILAELALKKAEKTNEPQDVTLAKDKNTAVLQQLPADDPYRETILTRLARLFRLEHSVLPRLQNRRASELLSESHMGVESKGLITPSSTVMRIEKYMKSPHDQEAVTNFIRETEDALKDMRHDDPDDLSALSALGTGYQQLFQMSKQISHADKAVEIWRKGLQTARNELAVQSLTGSISDVLYDVYSVTKLEIDMDMAIDALKRSVEVNKDLLKNLERLGSLLVRRYTTTDDEADLDLSIATFQKALTFVPAHHKKLRADILGSIGNAFGHRSQRLGTISDRDTAIRHFEQATEQFDQDDSARNEYLVPLAAQNMSRSVRVWDPAALDKAIESTQLVVEAAAKNTKQNAMGLGLLAFAHGHKYYVLKQKYDLDLAIKYYKKAMEIETSNERNDIAMDHMVRLGQLALWRYQDIQDAEDWKEGMRYLADALKGLTDAHQDCASALWLLGKGHRRTPLALQQENDEHLHNAALAFREALECSRYRPLDRVMPGVELLQVYALLKDWTQASRTASTIFSILPLLASRTLENSDKQWQAERMAGLASNAAAVALLANESLYCIAIPGDRSRPYCKLAPRLTLRH